MSVVVAKRSVMRVATETSPMVHSTSVMPSTSMTSTVRALTHVRGGEREENEARRGRRLKESERWRGRMENEGDEWSVKSEAVRRSSGGEVERVG
jgi:hypothetical protein